MNNRRQFLKSIFGVAAGLVVAPSVVKSKDDRRKLESLNCQPTRIPKYPLGATLETGFGLNHRKYRYCKLDALDVPDEEWQRNYDRIMNV